jgi:DNA helicase HerA-like ATPase
MSASTPATGTPGKRPLVDGHNMAILGITQSGKTAVGRELHATTPRVSIWVNERGDKRVENIAGTRARSLEGVKNALARDEYRVNFLPADRNEAIPELRAWLWKVANRIDRQLPMQVVVDEVDRVAPQSGKAYGNLPNRDACRDFTSEGAKRGVKFVGITQDPVTMDKQTLRQSRYRLVFPLSSENWDAVRKFGFDRDAVESAERYAGVLHNADGSVLEDRVKAEARFA